jgi:hypothetical protein
MRLNASNTKLSTKKVCLCLDDVNWQVIVEQLSRKEVQRSKIAKGSGKEASLIGDPNNKLDGKGAYSDQDDAS